MVLLFISLNLVLGYDWFNIAGVITVGFTLHVFKRKRVLNTISEFIDKVICARMCSACNIGFIPAASAKIHQA